MSGVFGYNNEIMNIISNDFTTETGSKTKERLMQEYGEPLFEIIAKAEFGGDMVELSGAQEKRIASLVDDTFDFAAQMLEQKYEEWMNDRNFAPFGFGRKDKFSFLNDAERLNGLWQNNTSARTTAKRSSARRSTANSTTENRTQGTVINNDGLQRIVNLKNQTTSQIADNTTFNQIQPVNEQVEKDPLEGKTPEEKKTILEQSAQTHRDNITKIANGTSEAVQNVVANMQNAEAAMNQAIDNDANINDEVKAQVKESQLNITAKSQEISSKEAEIAQTDASITQTEGAISNLQNALSSLPSPSGKEEDKEKDAKLAARKSELQSQIAAKQAELAQLQAQKQEQEAQKTQLETEKGQLEQNKEQIEAEELKDASPATKAAIQAYENARTNVETTKTNELQKAQNDLNDTIQKLNEVEAEIEQQKNASANTNFDINGMIEAFAQGQTGDCWLLSSLQALSNSEEGRKLLQDAVQINDDGTYTVKFNGADWAINITDADLRAARNSGQYSSGDDDVLLMEVAMQNYLTQVRNGQVQSDSANINATASEGGANPLNSGRATDLPYLLTGKTDFSVGNNTQVDEFFNKIENGNSTAYATVSFGAGANSSMNTLNAGAVVTGADAYTGHLWSIKSVSGDNVTLINPWNSSQEIVTTRAELARQNTEFVYQDLAA